MKICFLTFACPQWRVPEIIQAAKRHHYHGVDFRCDEGHAHCVEVTASKSFRRDVRQRLQDANLESPCFATSMQLNLPQSLDEAPARIEVAADIGCKGIRVFCGPAPDDKATPQVIATIGERLRKLAEQSSPAGVGIWLEAHDTLHRGVDAAAAVRAANHSAVGIVYDNMHPYRMHEPLDVTFQALSGLIRHTHMHDADADDRLHVATIKPLDQGAMPMNEMIRRLVASGYDGYLGGEWFDDVYGPTPDASLASFRQQMEQLMARNGLVLNP
jgi:sugar phosphate isomerase/epimerase